MPPVGHFPNWSHFPALADPETAGKLAFLRGRGRKEASKKRDLSLPVSHLPSSSLVEWPAPQRQLRDLLKMHFWSCSPRSQELKRKNAGLP